MARSRGGLTTKVHALVDGKGPPVRFVLTAGQTHDSKAAAELLSGIAENTVVLADKGYDAGWIRERRGAA
jgi:IS5 family transposase